MAMVVSMTRNFTSNSTSTDYHSSRSRVAIRLIHWYDLQLDYPYVQDLIVNPELATMVQVLRIGSNMLTSFYGAV